LSSSQARPGISADLFVIMVLLNFYLHVLIHYYFNASFDMFIIVFVCRALRPSDRRPFLRLWTMRARNMWPELRAA
jgi:hypothetical protein